MPTTDERLDLVEHKIVEMNDRLDRHSKRLEKLEGIRETVENMTSRFANVEKDIKSMKEHQSITDKKMLLYQKWTLRLVAILIILFFVLGIKNPETAKTVAETTAVVVKTI